MARQSTDPLLYIASPTSHALPSSSVSHSCSLQPVSVASMAAKPILYHLHTLFLFTKSDMRTLIPPVVRTDLAVRSAYSQACFLFRRLSLPLPPPPRAALFDYFILFFGCGFMPCNSHLQTRHFPERSRKMRSIIPTALSQQVAYPSTLHEHYDG